MIVKKPEGYYVMDAKTGTLVAGPYKTIEQANKPAEKTAENNSGTSAFIGSLAGTGVALGGGAYYLKSRVAPKVSLAKKALTGLGILGAAGAAYLGRGKFKGLGNVAKGFVADAPELSKSIYFNARKAGILSKEEGKKVLNYFSKPKAKPRNSYNNYMGI